jgi:hypothetical protein
LAPVSGEQRLDLIDPVGIRQPAVVAGLVADIEVDEQAGGEPDGEADDVDEGIGPVPRQRADRDRQIIAELRHAVSYS